MALAANALTTATAVAAEASGITLPANQAVVERLINVASDAIEGFCARKFGYWSGTETLAPPRGERVCLSRTPIDPNVTITTSLFGSAVTDFELEDAGAGILWRRVGWNGDIFEAKVLYEHGTLGSPTLATIPGTAQHILAVTYAGGYVLPKDDSPVTPRTLPYELEEVAIASVASLWRRRGVDLAARTYDDEGQGRWRPEFGGIIPGPMLTVLKRYQRLW